MLLIRAAHDAGSHKVFSPVGVAPSIKPPRMVPIGAGSSKRYASDGRGKMPLATGYISTAHVQVCKVQFAARKLLATKNQKQKVL